MYTWQIFITSNGWFRSHELDACNAITMFRFCFLAKSYHTHRKSYFLKFHFFHVFFLLNTSILIKKQHCTFASGFNMILAVTPLTPLGSDKFSSITGTSTWVWLVLYFRIIAEQSLEFCRTIPIIGHHGILFFHYGLWVWYSIWHSSHLYSRLPNLMLGMSQTYMGSVRGKFGEHC